MYFEREYFVLDMKSQEKQKDWKFKIIQLPIITIH